MNTSFIFAGRRFACCIDLSGLTDVTDILPRPARRHSLFELVVECRQSDTKGLEDRERVADVDAEGVLAVAAELEVHTRDVKLVDELEVLLACRGDAPVIVEVGLPTLPRLEGHNHFVQVALVRALAVQEQLREAQQLLLVLEADVLLLVLAVGPATLILEVRGADHRQVDGQAAAGLRVVIDVIRDRPKVPPERLSRLGLRWARARVILVEGRVAGATAEPPEVEIAGLDAMVQRLSLLDGDSAHNLCVRVQWLLRFALAVDLLWGHTYAVLGPEAVEARVVALDRQLQSADLCRHRQLEDAVLLELGNVRARQSHEELFAHSDDELNVWHLHSRYEVGGPAEHTYAGRTLPRVE